MAENRHSGHTVTRLTVHIVWVTKYRASRSQGRSPEAMPRTDRPLSVMPRTSKFSKELSAKTMSICILSILPPSPSVISSSGSRAEPHECCNRSIQNCRKDIGESISGRLDMELGVRAISLRSWWNNTWSIIAVRRIWIEITSYWNSGLSVLVKPMHFQCIVV